VVTFKHA